MDRFSELDMARLLFGVLITAAGVMSLLLFLVRIKRKELALLYFGLTASLYGVRLFIDGSAGYLDRNGHANLLITLVAGIPLTLFIAETSGGRWKKLVYWVLGAVSVAAGIGIVRVLLNLDHGIRTINNILVLVLVPLMLPLLFIPLGASDRNIKVLRIGFLVFVMFVIYTNLVSVGLVAGNSGLEFIGFVAFLGCLGYVAASRTQRNEERLLSLSKEMEIARGIQAGLLPEKNFSAAGLTAASRYVPASSVAGDFYDFLPKDGGLGVLVADVSGHGVPAALSASMVKVAIRAQRDWADDPARVLSGLNSILCGNLQGQFVTAGYLYLNPACGALAYAGAGHPPLLAWRGREKKIESLEENGLMLGIFPEGAYKCMTAALEPGDRFVLYTDGITEAPSLSGEEFGMERFKGFVAEHAESSAQELCDALVKHVTAWSGNSSREQHDDLTLIVVDYKAA
ncbi:MAG TPA: PP2C family protein-serine/threonine phosphatase [Candidatus Angelobacter sp.]